MASKQEIIKAYDYLDQIIRLDMGEKAEITCALFDGDFSKTLEQAQADKHDWILKGVNFKTGNRVLDIGCGYGPILREVRRRGGVGYGITLSDKQVAACVKDGLKVESKDWKEMSPETYGKFDAVVSVGAFEHFCSRKEFQAGKQDEIYEQFFKLCANLLPEHGRLYLQTMMWGKNFPGEEAISLKAPKSSIGYMLAVLEKEFPGSWPPSGEEQIVRCASKYFRLLEDNNGRLDYIETHKRWGSAWKFDLRKIPIGIGMLTQAIASGQLRDFLYQMEALMGAYNTEGFKQEFIDHQRMFFEKI